MRVLIAGCGYVGVPLGAALVAQGHEVFGLRRTHGAADVLAAAGIRPLLGDITRPGTLAELPHAYDWVVSCVASSHGGVDEYRAVYLKGTRNLLAWLAPAGLKKFVYTSSTSVYGQTDGSEVTETSPTEPEVETAKVLLEAERVVLRSCSDGKLPAVILRLAGIYGPGRGYWLNMFRKGEAVIEGKGERILNMIHRDDAVGAIIATLELGRPGEIYNVADDQPVAQIEVMKWLSQTLAQPMPSTAPGPEAAGRKRGLTSKKVSNAKLKRGLGYSLLYPSFREGFEAELG